MHLRDLFTSNQPRLPWKRLVLASLGVAVTVALLGLVGDVVGMFVVLIGFAPSALLVFALPEAPVSQPAAVVGGHMVSSVIGVLCGLLLSAAWWSVAIAAGVAVAAMMLLRMVHPPAVANAVIAAATGAGWMFLVMPVLSASLIIVIAGMIWHRVSRTQYPHAPSMRK